MNWFGAQTDPLAQLHDDLSADLNRIARRFKSPLLTLIVRNPQLADGDVVLTNDPDHEAAVAALVRFVRKEESK